MQLKKILQTRHNISAPAWLLLLSGFSLALIVFELVAYLWRFVLLFVVYGPASNIVQSQMVILSIASKIRYIVILFVSFLVCKKIAGSIIWNGVNLGMREQFSPRKLALIVVFVMGSVLVFVYTIGFFQSSILQICRGPLVLNQSRLFARPFENSHSVEGMYGLPVKKINMGVMWNPQHENWGGADWDSESDESDVDSRRRIFGK